MKRLNDLEYLKLNKFQVIVYNLKLFFSSIPGWIKAFFLKIWSLFLGLGRFLTGQVKDIGYTFIKGNWAVKLSFIIFGFGNLYYGQILRGLLFLVFEIVFLVYFFLPEGGGLFWIRKCHFFQTGATIADQPQVVIPGGGPAYTVQTPFGPIELREDLVIAGEDSVRYLFLGLLSVVFVIAFLYTWRLQVKQCRICMDITSKGKKLKSGKQDLQSLLDDQFHKTLLSLPLLGILLFTVLPLIYMIIIAFTNYGYYNDGSGPKPYDGISRLIQWVGFEHFENFFSGTNDLGPVFGDILIWTLTWAFFATFTNYFLGMMVALLINKKGIKFKKVWRTILVMTIAIPQFVSLLYVRQLFEKAGVFGKFLSEIPYISNLLTEAHALNLWEHPLISKILLIVINIWIGIPYVMLMATGILMNIPADLYESSRVDGATPVQQFTKITLPYMLFVTGPYLLTSFVGNLNNFNVIYLLSGGRPSYTFKDGVTTAGGVVPGKTDLLVTWLFNMTMAGEKVEYYSASVIGIMVFVVVAVLSLIVYNIIPSTKNEEDYA